MNQNPKYMESSTMGGRENIMTVKETGQIATGACGGRTLCTDLQSI